MKKVIKFSMILLLIFTFTFAFSETAYAKTCTDYSYEDCPVPGTDDNGNACTLYVSKCVINTEAKRCNEYSEFVSIDDYGNKCGRDSSGQNYVQENYKSCLSYKSAATCPQDRCKWITNSKGFHECDAIITRSTTACETLTDLNRCDLRTDCDIFTNSSSKKVCISITNPTPTSTSCRDITDPDECAGRTDCDWGYTLQGKPGCIVKSGANNGSNNEVDDPNGIILEKEEFVCSDVKLLTSAWLFIRILSPFLVILFGSLDFFKAMSANDEKKMKEARGKFFKRLIAFLILIVLPFTIQFIFAYMGTYGSQNVCLLKCIATNNTSSEGCD